MNKTIAIILASLFSALALTDTTNTGFFKQLESELRVDYLACTGDSTLLPVKELIRWKRAIDSLAGLPGYAGTARAYQKETGRSPTTDRPCRVIRWQQDQDSVAAVTAMKNKQTLAAQAETAAESLIVYREIAKLPARPFAFNGIPFGASKRSFFWLAKRNGFSGIIDNGSHFIFRQVPLGGRSWLGAFYFDTLGLCRYELEGTGFPADSLDGSARVDAAHLASLFQKEIGVPPHRVNRISRDEIVQDELAITAAWSQSSWSVAVGLSRNGYHYYAKAIATNRPLPRK